MPTTTRQRAASTTAELLLSPAATAPSGSRPPGTPRHLPKTPPDETIPKRPREGNDTPPLEDEPPEGWRDCLRRLEARILVLEGRLEEEERERRRLEQKLEETVQQTREERPESQEENGMEWKKEIKEVEERIMGKMEEEKKKKKRRCIIFTDSNGRNGVTASSVRYHMPEEDKEEYDINLVIAYRIGEAADIVDQGDLAINGATIILDCLSNDARNTKRAPRLSLDQHAQALDSLRKKLWQKGAARIVVCSVKPTQRADVTEYVDSVHRYLRSVEGEDGGHGCHSQVRLEHLGVDGLHIKPRFYHVLQQTYAYAILGKQLPDPTPIECFAPYHVRQAYRREWPAFNQVVREPLRAPNTNHGRN